MNKIIKLYFQWNGVALTFSMVKKILRVILDIVFIFCIVNVVYSSKNIDSALFYGFIGLATVVAQYWLVANNLSKQVKELKNKDSGEV